MRWQASWLVFFDEMRLTMKPVAIMFLWNYDNDDEDDDKGDDHDN